MAAPTGLMVDVQDPMQGQILAGRVVVTSQVIRRCVALASLLLCLFATTLRAAAPVVLHPALHELSLGTHLDVLEDAAKQWRIDDIMTEQVSTLFSPSHVSAPNFGFTTSAYWIRFTVINPLAEDRQWYLEIAYPPMDKIDVYIPQPAGGFQISHAGDRLPFDARAIKHRHFLFPLHTAAQSQQTYYIRFETDGVIDLPLTLLSPSALAERIDHDQIRVGLYHGAILVMLVYNFFLFLSIRDPSYLYYVLFNSGWVLALLSLNGLAFQYLWPHWVWWANNSLLFFFCFSFVWGVQFSRTFLQTRQYTPGFDALLRAILVFGSLGVVASLVASYHFGVRLTSAIGMTTVLVWLTGCIRLTQGSRPARYYVLAWSALIFGVAVLSLKNFGILPHNPFTVWAPQIGSATEIILLSFGLADRIKALQRETEQAQKELLETQLSVQNALLKEVHHRVKNNLQVISSLLNLQSGHVTDPQVSDMFKESRQRVESMALVHEKLYQAHDSTRIDFSAYARTLVTHLGVSYGAASAGITLRLNLDAVTLGVDTAIPCGLILNELVANALQHAFPAGHTGEVRVDLHVDKEGLCTLCVGDTGIGFPSRVDFRHADSLGLQLVTTLTEQLEGLLELEREGGTTFRLVFAELRYKERNAYGGPGTYFGS